jgi:hypothetical protein
MKSLRKLLISMSHDAYHSSEKLLNTISILNAINKQKRLVCESYTTEIIDGIPAHVMEIMSTSLKSPILLPTKTNKSIRISVVFPWGTLILVQQEPHN